MLPGSWFTPSVSTTSALNFPSAWEDVAALYAASVVSYSPVAPFGTGARSLNAADSLSRCADSPARSPSHPGRRRPRSCARGRPVRSRSGTGCASGRPARGPRSRAAACPGPGRRCRRCAATASSSWPRPVCAQPGEREQPGRAARGVGRTEPQRVLPQGGAGQFQPGVRLLRPPQRLRGHHRHPDRGGGDAAAGGRPRRTAVRLEPLDPDVRAPASPPSRGRAPGPGRRRASGPWRGPPYGAVGVDGGRCRPPHTDRASCDVP